MHGLLRVRTFTQDDAHIFCREDQVVSEVTNVVKFINELYSVFGFTYRATLSTMPEDHMGDEATWEKATEALKNALEEMKVPYVVAEGEGAFYGPKIDFHVRDVIGREWQCATIQVDFQMPERFEITYKDADGNEKRPVMIHRALYGSIERFFGILIEHYAGAFPTWLAPVQAVILPVSEKYVNFAREVSQVLSKENIRVELDDRNETLGYRIRENQMKKVPYMIIIGEKEKETGRISVRTREGKDLHDIALEDFIRNIKEEISSRSNTLKY